MSPPAAVCAGCGCLCDDVVPRLRAGRPVEVERACGLGREWWAALPSPEGPAARVEGRPAQPAEALEAALRLLDGARSPLVYGLVEASCEALSTAVALADRLRALLDPARPAGAAAWAGAFLRQGGAYATLGEIRARATLFVAWGCDPERTHPRLLERTFDASGLHVAGARRLVQVLPPGAPASERAERVLRVPPDGQLAWLWALRAAARGDPFRAEELPADEIRWLAQRMRGADAGAWLYDPAPEPPSGVADAALAVVREVSESVPFAALPLAGAGNARGAEAVLTAECGYPFAVSFAAGHPEHDPEANAAVRLLRRGEVDAVLVIGCDPDAALPDDAAAALAEIGSVVVDSRDSAAARRAAAFLRTAPLPAAAATLHRLDGVALRAEPVLSSSFPSDVEALDRLARSLGAGPRSGVERAGRGPEDGS